MNSNQNNIPKWFWIAGIISLLWNIMGVLSFVSHTFITEETLCSLSAEEQALYKEYPLWTTVVFAIAVLTGLLGSISILVKKRISLILFQLSLIAILIQMTHNIAFTNSIEVYGLVQSITMPIIVIAFALFLVWFAKSSIRKNWLK